MLHVIIEAQLVWIDEASPGVFPLELPAPLFFFIDAAEAIFVGVGDLLLSLMLDLLHFPYIAVGCWCLHLEAAQDLVRTVDHTRAVHAPVDVLIINEA